MSRRRLLLPLGLLCLGLLSACRDDNSTAAGCRVDADCANETVGAEGFRCEVETGVCYCRTDDPCPRNQFCNTVGFCQDRTGCTKNSDCLGTGLFCDTTRGTCLSEGRCSTDLHCRIGQVCDLRRELCVEGCRSAGDCNNTSCRCDDGACGCAATTPAELAACEIGACDPSFCQDETFCRYGEKCEVLTDAGTDDAQCFSDYDPRRRPYCATCTFGGGTDTCGRGGNYCLVDTRNVGNYFCGTDCSGGQSCPRGYACQDVIVVSSQWQCGGANPSCPTKQNLPCNLPGDKPCPGGTFCSTTEEGVQGYCGGTCAGGEGANIGYCSCVEDNDCFQDTCTGGECSISGQACITTDDCRPVRCVEFGESRGCLIGQNCAPADGLTCNDVL